MDGEDVNTLAGYLQMAILLCRVYFGRISFYLTFWGTFLQLDEIAGGRMFALEKAKNSLRPIIIGSLWRRCAARLGVAEVRSNAATFFMSQYTNFIQFGGESDGATRCAQVIAFSGNMGSTFRRESSCRDST